MKKKPPKNAPERKVVLLVDQRSDDESDGAGVLLFAEFHESHCGVYRWQRHLGQDRADDDRFSRVHRILSEGDDDAAEECGRLVHGAFDGVECVDR